MHAVTVFDIALCESEYEKQTCSFVLIAVQFVFPPS